MLDAMREYAAAKPYYEQTLAILEKRLGSSHPSTEIVRNNLAALNRTIDRKGLAGVWGKIVDHVISFFHDQ